MIDFCKCSTPWPTASYTNKVLPYVFNDLCQILVTCHEIAKLTPALLTAFAIVLYLFNKLRIN